MSTISKKICLIGDFAVGKTSLIRRFVEGQFSDQYLSTVGVKISRKSLEQVQLIIWDIEGSTKFKAIAPTYLQGATGAVIVGDVTQKETLEHIIDHIQSFLTVNPQGYIVTALNKSDLVETEYLDNILQKHQQIFNTYNHVVATYLTSAKIGNNVDEIFKLLADYLIKDKK